MLLFWATLFSVLLISLVILSQPFFYSFNRNQLIKQKSHFYLLAGIILFMSLGSVSLYLYLGKSQAVIEKRNTLKHANEIKAEIKKMGSRQNIIHALKSKLLQMPENKENARGWFILGKLYFNENKIQDSNACFQKAAKLNPSSEYQLQSVIVKFYLNKHLDKNDKQTITQLLRRSANDPNLLNLLALDAYQDKKYQIAIRYWERLLMYFPPQSEDFNHLMTMIKQAQRETS